MGRDAAAAPLDLTRPDAGLAVVREWAVPAGGERVAADAAVAGWTAGRWPAGRLAAAAYLGVDEPTVLTYEQWTDASAYRAAGAEHTAPGPGAAVPYTRYRSVADGAGRVGCVVAVSVAADGPDLARAWIGAVLAALAGTDEQPPGGIAGHFHVSLDGTRVLNYAEWEDAESHRRAVEAGGGSIATGRLWRRVQTMPGIRHLAVRRYHPYRTVPAPPAPGPQ